MKIIDLVVLFLVFSLLIFTIYIYLKRKKKGKTGCAMCSQRGTCTIKKTKKDTDI